MVTLLINKHNNHLCQVFVCLLQYSYAFICSGDADIVIDPSYPLARPRSRKPSQTPSMPMIPLRRLEPFKETMEDEVNNEQKGCGPSSASSSSTLSRVSASHWQSHRGTKDCEPEGEEQQTVSPPTVWSPEPPERGTGEARNPLLRRSQWKPQDQRGQQKWGSCQNLNKMAGIIRQIIWYCS